MVYASSLIGIGELGKGGAMGGGWGGDGGGRGESSSEAVLPSKASFHVHVTAGYGSSLGQFVRTCLWLSGEVAIMQQASAGKGAALAVLFL